MAKKKRPSAGESKRRPEPEAVDFEQALADVESIVSKLESGELGLTDSLEQYEIGIKRLKQCHAILRHAERRVMLLSGVDADGTAEGAPFEDPEPPAQHAKRSKRNNPPLEPNDDSQSSVDDLPGLF